MITSHGFCCCCFCTFVGTFVHRTKFTRRSVYTTTLLHIHRAYHIYLYTYIYIISQKKNLIKKSSAGGPTELLPPLRSIYHSPHYYHHVLYPRWSFFPAQSHFTCVCENIYRYDISVDTALLFYPRSILRVIYLSVRHHHKTHINNKSSSAHTHTHNPSLIRQYIFSFRLLQILVRPCCGASKNKQQIYRKMGIAISTALTRLFGKKQMRILMGKVRVLRCGFDWRL